MSLEGPGSSLAKASEQQASVDVKPSSYSAKGQGLFDTYVANHAEDAAVDQQPASGGLDKSKLSAQEKALIDFFANHLNDERA